MTHLPRRQRWPFIVVVAAAAASAAAPAPPAAAPPEIHPQLPRTPHLAPSSARCRQTVLIARKVVCLLVVVVALLFFGLFVLRIKGKASAARAGRRCWAERGE